MLAVTGLVCAGVMIDRRERPESSEPAPRLSALSVVSGQSGTWFCPGASGSGGFADLAIEMTSVASTKSEVVVSVFSGGADARPPETVEIQIEPGASAVLQPSVHAPDAQWVGAVVETGDAGVVVDQIVSTRSGGVGRSTCLTRTSQHWSVPYGATRAAVEGERFVVMLLNPFPDFAVAEVDLIADVGRDTVEGVVVPARSVIGFDVTEELTVAASVSAAVRVLSGRLSASWIQVADGPLSGSGAWTAPAAPDAAALWYLPTAQTAPGRRDVLAVTNPSPVRAAEVDVEFVFDDPAVAAAPLELTVRPERTALVDLSEQRRLESLGAFAVAVRALGADPVGVTVSLSTVVTGVVADEQQSAGVDAESSPSEPPEDLDAPSAEASPTGLVAGGAALMGADAAARRWMVAVDSVMTDADESAGVGSEDQRALDRSSVVVLNPSAIAIALVDLRVGDETLRSFELGPRRRSRIPTAWLGEGRFVVEVDSSAPVIVARELVGLTSRSASLAVAASRSTPLDELR